jgi:hypothetical protein
MSSEGEQIQNLNTLAGEVHALRAIALVLVRTHQDLAELSAHLNRVQQVSLAKSQASPVREEYIEGLLGVFGEVKAVLQSEQSLRARRGTAG